jgi:hypothetical protein
MEIIPSVENLAYDITYTTTQNYPDWVTGTTYYKGDRVNDPYDDKTYEMQWDSYTSTVQPHADSTQDCEEQCYHYFFYKYCYTSYCSTTPWKLVSNTSFYTIASISSNAQISLSSAWSNGVTLHAGQRVYDPEVFHDYEVRKEISSGDNTLSPHASLLSPNDDVAERYLDLGPSNAFKILDGQTNNRLAYNYYDAGTYLWVELTVQDSEYSDRLCIVGMRNVSQINITLDGGTEVPLSLQYGTTGVYRSSYIYEHTASAGTLYRVEFEPVDSSKIIEVGLVYAGTAITLGTIEPDIEVGVKSFSKTDRDIYGNVSFVERGQANNFRATINYDKDEGDYVNRVIELYGRRPTMWNFNSVDTSYDRLIMQGWAENVSTTIQQTWSKDKLILDMQEVVK